MNDHRDERKWEIMRGSWRGMRARGPGRGRGGNKEEIRGEEGKRCGATTSEFSVG